MALGVAVDLGQASEGVVLVENKAERAEELDTVVNEVRLMRSFPPSMAAKVYGRLNFAEAQCWTMAGPHSRARETEGPDGQSSEVRDK